MNIATALEETARLFPDCLSIAFKGKSYSYKHLNEEVNRLANGLREIGMKKGDILTILLPNSPIGVISFYAGLKLGAICVYINPMLKGQELKAILIDSKAKVFITHSRCFESLRPEREELRHLKAIISVDATATTDEILSIGKLTEKGSASFTTVDVDPHDLAVIIYSSGTTAVPKGAVFTHESLPPTAKSVKYFLGKLGPGDRMLNVSPLSTSLSIVSVLIGGLLSGASVYLLDRFDPEEFGNSICQDKITIIIGVPTMYFALNALPDLNAEDLRTLKFAVSTSAPLPLEVRKQFEEKFGKKITQIYGNTEASRCLVADPREGERRVESIGKALPDVELKIVDIKGVELPTGEVGEVCARFPGGMIGYWGRPEETEKALRNGWLHTEDMGKLDEDGFLYLIDRKSDVIITGGFNLYPAEIENILHTDQRVLEATVIGIPDDRLGEIPVAFVVMKRGTRSTERELIELVRQKLAKYKAPRKIRFVESLPKNPGGKVLKRILRE